MKKLSFLLSIAVLLSLTSCKSIMKKIGWSESAKQSFNENCIKEAVKTGVDKATATSYCDCMLDKIVKKDIAPLEVISLDEKVLQELATSCVNSGIENTIAEEVAVDTTIK